MGIPSGPCYDYIPLGLQIMTLHILASNLHTPHCASGEYVTLHVPPLPSALLLLTIPLQWMSLTVERGREREADLRLQDKRQGKGPSIILPSRRWGGTRDERDGGHSRVLRCEAHLDTALAAGKTVDFSPLYLSTIPFCCLWGEKDMQILAQHHSKTMGERIFKMSGHCSEKKV